MSNLEKIFKTRVSQGKKLYLPYVTLGDPDLRFSLKIIKTLAQSGADAIEIGIPFSDPIADGPTIQKAIKRALENKVSLKLAFEILKKLKKNISQPLLFMSYYNPIFRFGENKFFKKTLELGLDGVIIPDLSIEEAKNFAERAKKIDLACIFFVSPTTSPERMRIINKISSGFVYYISLTGVTGAKKKLALDLIKNLKIAKQIITKPLCVGFGISTPTQVKDVKRFCDGIIIGSAIVDIIEKNLRDKEKLLNELFKFSKSIRDTLDEKDISS